LGESSQTHGGGHASTIGAGAIIIALFGIPWIIGMPILLSGIAIQRYATPSTTNKAISLGLMATGGLLSLPGNIIGLSIPSGIIEEKLLNISFRSRIHAARHRLDNVRMELDLIKIIIRDLERLYS